MPRHPLLQGSQLGLVAAEQVEHVLRGAHRALDAAQRITGDELLKPGERHQHLVGRRGEPLAERRRLRRHVVRAARHHQIGVPGREVRQVGEQRHAAVPHQDEAVADLQLLDVLGEVARGHALVHVLVAGEVVELLDARLHVVAGQALALGDGAQVDLRGHGLVVVDDTGGHLDAQLGLRSQHGQPQLPLGQHLVLGRPHMGQLRRGVTGGEDIGDTRLGGHVASVYGARPLVAATGPPPPAVPPGNDGGPRPPRERRGRGPRTTYREARASLSYTVTSGS